MTLCLNGSILIDILKYLYTDEIINLRTISKDFLMTIDGSEYPSKKEIISSYPLCALCPCRTLAACW